MKIINKENGSEIPYVSLCFSIDEAKNILSRLNELDGKCEYLAGNKTRLTIKMYEKNDIRSSDEQVRIEIKSIEEKEKTYNLFLNVFVWDTKRTIRIIIDEVTAKSFEKKLFHNLSENKKVWIEGFIVNKDNDEYNIRLKLLIEDNSEIRQLKVTKKFLENIQWFYELNSIEELDYKIARLNKKDTYETNEADKVVGELKVWGDSRGRRGK